MDAGRGNTNLQTEKCLTIAKGTDLYAAYDSSKSTFKLQREQQTGCPVSQNPRAETRNISKLHTDICQTVAEGTESYSVYNSSKSQSKEKCDQSWTESQQQKQNTDLMASDKDFSSKFSRDAAGFKDSHVTAALKGLHLADKEQESASDDELEQFVFQPKSIRQGTLDLIK